MPAGCFDCFEGVLMGLRKSKPHNNRHYHGDDGLIDVISTHQVVDYDAVHRDAVTCVTAYSEAFCLSGSADRTLALFNLRSGVMTQRWRGHDKEITKVVVSKEEIVYSSSRDKNIKLWKIGDGSSSEITTYEGHKLVVTGIDLNTDETMLFSGSRDNSVRLWDVNVGDCIQQSEVTRNLVSCVKWIPDSHEVAQTGEDKMVRIWDTRTMTPAFTFPPKQHFQTCCDCSSDGRYILTCNNGFNRSGCEATLWDVRQRKQVHQYVGHDQTASACMFLPFADDITTQPLIATASHDSTVRIWKRDTKECILIEEFPGSGPLTGLAAFKSGSILVSSFNIGIYNLSLERRDDGRLTLKRMIHF
ncbi:WD repeat-containing protein 31-like [Actinia tenebrosa]|uniref:WD repeat-containing protein 31-like n=1 Tax=Actinia tenebrosa TaxID=6105 RepID=A0A6P8I028_ACTTE|nr:WD repeat-containing protein 31-like [Actinia tenebrosa]